MKIVSSIENQEVITLKQATDSIERKINRYCGNYFYIVKYRGQVISFSGQYYKIAWNTIGDVRRALSLKFGAELPDALIEEGLLVVEKCYV